MKPKDTQEAHLGDAERLLAVARAHRRFDSRDRSSRAETRARAARHRPQHSPAPRALCAATRSPQTLHSTSFTIAFTQHYNCTS